MMNLFKKISNTQVNNHSKYMENNTEIKSINLKYDGYFKIQQINLNINGVDCNRELLKKDNAVAALIYNTITDKYILIEQYRVGSMSRIIEVVAGTMKENEDMVECIYREIEEEVGYKVDNHIYFGGKYASVGFTNEKVHLFYCEVSEKISDGGGLLEEAEFIKIKEYTKDELKTMQIDDMKTELLILLSLK